MEVIFDPQKLALPKAMAIDEVQNAPSRKPPRHKSGEEFLKGPIPLNWLGQAAQLRGKGLAVGLAVWFLAGLIEKRQVTLTHAILARFDIGPKAGGRGLKALEKNGLVSVARHAGRSPIVTILEVQTESTLDSVQSTHS